MVNLGFRSCYSLMESVLTIPDIVRIAKQNQESAVTLCDYQVMHGAMAFYRMCEKQQIKPIFAMEVTVEENNQSFNFNLYAKDDLGYQKLMQLSTLLQDEPLSLEMLNDEHLYVVLSDDEGNIKHLISEQNGEELTKTLKHLINKLPMLLLGITNVDNQYSKEVKYRYKELYQKLSIPTVAISKIYYEKADDYLYYRSLKAIKQQTFYEDNKLITNPNRFYRTSEQLSDLYESEDLAKAEEIANNCNVKMALPKAQLPIYENKYEVDSFTYLKQLCFAGLKKRLNNQLNDQYVKRLNYELSVIEKMGYADYFLIVFDIVNFAKKRGINVGPGRGSAAGALMSYCLGITQIDPLQYGLIFERFLNPERISMPDIDIDFPDNRREEIIDYVVEKYGSDRVAHVVTYGCFQARQALRDAGKLFFVNVGVISSLCGLIDPKNDTLEKVYQSNNKFRYLIDGSKENQKMFQVAKHLEGLPRHISTHAAGIIMSQEPITKYCPLIKLGDNEYATQFSKNYLEDLGLIKMDFLGLKNLTIIDDIAQSIKGFNLNDIPLDDVKTFQLISQADTVGVFQLESAGIKEVLKKLRPQCFEEIATVLALYRPGPMENIDMYLANRKNPSQINYFHKDLKPILAPTYGIMIYQEQIMQVAQVMGGFSLGKADILRKAISKKQIALMEDLKTEFVQGATNKGYDSQTIEIVYQQILKFAGYGFNKAHAISYALIVYQLAYLKANYPAQFYTALLNGVKSDQSKTKQYLNEARRKGLNILAPSINYSTENYYVSENNIRLPLSIIKGIGVSNIEKLLNERNQHGLFADYDDFVIRCYKLGQSNIKNLIYAGALDSFGFNRQYLENNLELKISYAKMIGDNGLTSFSGIFDECDDRVTKENIYQKLHNEYAVLGFYLSDHPLKVRRDELGCQFLDSQKVLEKNYGSFVGKLVRVKRHKTKTGDDMAFLTFEDDMGELDTVLMPNLYRANIDKLSVNHVYKLQGKKGRNDSIIIKTIQEDK